MRIAIIGPTHPYKGGIPLHTTQLAHTLEEAGHSVELISWEHQYPGLLYPGVQRVPRDKPEMKLFKNTTELLNWYNPIGWYKLGRRLRSFDMVIMTFFVAQFQGSAGLAMMRAMGRHRHPKVVAICHNVKQHDKHPGPEKQITKWFLSQVDLVITHSDEQAAAAREFTTKPVRVAAMAAHLPENARQAAQHTRRIQHRLAFFGLIRKYKGVDVLLRAVALVPNLKLSIAGEPRGKLESEIKALIQELNIADRVDFRPGYLPVDDFADFFGSADALVLPYRGGTGTQNVAMAFAHGLPVIATRTATMAEQIRPGVDGLLCKPGDLTSLVDAIRHFYSPGVAEMLLNGVSQADDKTGWQAYIDVLLGD